MKTRIMGNLEREFITPTCPKCGKEYKLTTIYFNSEKQSEGGCSQWFPTCDCEGNKYVSVG